MFRRLFAWLRRRVTRCQLCGALGAVQYHQRTSYTDEAANWITLCPPCQEDNDKHWDAMWEEYYRGCM